MYEMSIEASLKIAFTFSSEVFLHFRKHGDELTHECENVCLCDIFIALSQCKMTQWIGLRDKLPQVVKEFSLVRFLGLLSL